MFHAKQYNPPAIYKRNGQIVALCAIRKHLVPRSPEEIIRQKFIQYLLSKWHIPPKDIAVEEPLSRYIHGANGRIDILVLNKIGNNKHAKPFIVVECKASDVQLTDDTLDQARHYANNISASYIILTNGHKTNYYVNNKRCAQITPPKCFNDLARSAYKYVRSVKRKRPSLKDLFSNEVQCLYKGKNKLGGATKKELFPFIINLDSMLKDFKDKKFTMPLPFKTPYFTIIKHYIRKTTFGNAAGGAYTGRYRSFLIRDGKGNNQIISMNIFGVPGFTSLVVAVDDYEKSHHSLQLNIDRHVRQENGVYTVCHNGALTKGNTGPVKTRVVIDYVKAKRPDLVIDNEIVLGHLPDNELFTWNNSRKLICNLIHYALLREDIRRRG